MASESEDSVYSPVASFAYNLPLALAIGVGLVLLLANALVRRTMEPLAALTAGTMRIARHDLSARVDVTSRDEFGELASSFNTMADQLSRQFRQIEAASAIDRAVIEESNATTAVRALLDGVRHLLPTKSAAVLLPDAADGLAVLFHSGPGTDMAATPLEVDPAALFSMQTATPYRLAEPGSVPAAFAGANIGAGGSRVLLAPLAVRSTVVGVAALEARDGAAFEEEDIARALQLIDQAAVALNEVRLRRELIELGSEALRALANAIDAKSRWTTGHSERVSDLAWALARRLAVGVEDLETLHRGGLLHDIGKIGVATEILDFPGRLDEDMRRAIEAHPVIGARILEPVRVFQPLIPIVRHHHERWDGTGYPDRLAGTDIPYLTRILTVADVFDAMLSPRPYRAARPRDLVIEHILNGAGSAFDPEVVTAFRDVMDAGWKHDAGARRAPGRV